MRSHIVHPTSQIAHRPPSAFIALPLSLSQILRLHLRLGLRTFQTLSVPRRTAMYHPHLESCPRVVMDALLPLAARLRPFPCPIGTRWTIQRADCGISVTWILGRLGYFGYFYEPWTMGLRRVFTLWFARWKVLDQPQSTTLNRVTNGPLSATLRPNLGCTDN